MARKVIVLQGDPLIDESHITAAATAIVPGDLVEPGSTAGEVIEHATAEGNAAPIFALENPWVEPAAGVLSIDHPYAAADTIRLAFCKTGDKINARFAVSQTLAEGTALQSDGNGQLVEAVTAAATTELERDSIVAYCAEDITIAAAIGRGAVRVA